MELIPLKFPEFIVTLVLIGWGALLLVPLDTFSSSQGYYILSSLLSENQWGLLTITLGLSLLAGNVFNKYSLRKYSLLLSCLVWVVVFVSIFLSNHGSTGTIAYIGYALLSKWLHSQVCDQQKIDRNWRLSE